MSLIVDKVMALRQSQIKQYPCRSNRASELGHPCERYLVFMRTRWEEKTMHDVVLQSIFNIGNMMEKDFVAELNEAGVDIIEQQRAFEWKEYNITGHLDFKVLVAKGAKPAFDIESMPVEFKSCSPFVFDSINCLDDIKNSKYVHVRKYPAQLTLYMLMDNKEHSIFIFKNKITGMLKEIPMDLDYEFAESLIQKACRINKHVEKGTVPGCVPYEDNLCGKCGFIHICAPEIKRDALRIEDDPNIEATLVCHEELKPFQSRYNKYHKELMEKFKNIEKIVIGDWFITGKATKTGWKTTISKL